LKRKVLSIFIALVLALSLCLVTAGPVAAQDGVAPTIDGVIDTEEWGMPLCTAHDNSWGDSWDVIDGYHGSWGDTWNPNYYSHIPEGIEMVTSFGTGHRVTEFKIPMSLMFDGEHGWNGPSGGETLLLGGTFSGEDSQGTFDMLWWPTGIDHSQEGTYATTEVPPPTKAAILKERGVPGKGLDTAPGLDKEFNPNSQAGNNAGKK
jgi:hypothetical protein